MSNKLPPLDLQEDKDKYQAFEEKIDIKFNKCKHEPVVISGTELKCRKCGAGWYGSDILTLKKLLDSV